ncbi:glycosyltransferase [Levilactobacillus bambusae]|uniref:Glycosyl transferase n=1 Tax=Levilactobacillus bambusae TaxID=2024736 RepID=A0A2V1N0P6_9LACO|nr:glycosyltransferase [Levilactobacillus bambusae]PWF99919.1 glycosyl transferase [Levilactobacillus bambusae]
MNFFVNQAMGVGNSGVEHAQFYRAKRFDQANLPYRFIFVELIKNLHEAMDVWQIKDDQVINMWEYFVLGEDYAVSGLTRRSTAEFRMLVDQTKTNRMSEARTTSGLRIREFYVKKPNPDKPETLLVSTDRVELFNIWTGQLMVSYRKRVVGTESQITNIHLYHQANDQHLYFQNMVLLKRYFFHQLNRLYGGQNTFIVDRGEDNEVALFDDPVADWHKVDVVHADHLSDRNVLSAPLWNNYYEYVLTHLNQIDRLVVATEMQRQDLLQDFPTEADKIVTIPVGGVNDHVDAIETHTLMHPVKLVTISRLATEKHIDLIVQAVVKLHRAGHAVTLDIFGQGETRSKLNDLIQREDAREYIELKGLTKQPEAEYPHYDAFISASYSEGFGLTYIEAMSAALPVITFNARFGAIELVHDGVNGFLRPFKRDDEAFNVEQLTLGIEQLVAVQDYPALQRQVVESVTDYQDHVIAEKWRRLIHEL